MGNGTFWDYDCPEKIAEEIEKIENSERAKLGNFQQSSFKKWEIISPER